MQTADMVLLNGKVYSVDQNDGQIRAEGVAVKDGIIIKVGKHDTLQSYIGDYTKVIDCKGNTVLPGLCDAHCHPSIAAGLYSGCDLFGVYIQKGETPDEIIDRYLDRLQVYIEKHPDDVLIRGTGWVMGNFVGSRVPNRRDIDRICSDRPVILESFCQHNLWVNTKALELAGIDERISDVKTGKIYREKTGYPSGLFNDMEAMQVIKQNVPGYDFSVEQYKEAFLYYQKNFANKYGVTLIQDCMHSDNARDAYVQLAKEGRLTLRVRGTYMLEPSKFQKQLSEFIERKGTDNVGNDFRIDTIKIFSEGGFSLIDPYEKSFLEENNLPEGYNEPLYWTDKNFIDSAIYAMESGFQIHIHAMGDNSIRQSVSCLIKAQEVVNLQTRNVIAHLMLVRDEEIQTMKKGNIIANCQPRWMVYDSDIRAMTPMIGMARAKASYPLRRFLDAGVVVAFGTDFPVTPPPDTMHEIQCAMTRSVFPEAPDYNDFQGKILGDEEPATLKEAVKALSLGGAYQMFLETVTGSIEEGKSADLVILDSNLEETDIEQIYKITVEKTIFKGTVVYEKE